MKTWTEIAREKQKLPKGNWSIWLLMTGRGFGKTRTGSENIMQLIMSGKYKRVGLIGKSIQEVKQVMVEGPAGILETTVIKDSNKFKYYRSKRQIEFTNGAKIYLLSGDSPDAIRGYQFDLVWIDEFAKFQKPSDLLDQIMFSLRLGSDIRCIITTTPRPLQILKKLTKDSNVVLTQGSTFENSNNLSPKFIKMMHEQYANVRIGKQELEGQLILEKERPLWHKSDIIYQNINLENLEIVVIGVDPAVTNSKLSDETGIIVSGQGYDKNFYVLDDLSGKYTGVEWAKRVVRAAHDYDANCVAVETNNGGNLVIENLKSLDSGLPIKSMHAVKGKIARAEPISILYEANRVRHVKEFTTLEIQMCNMSYDENDKSYSPDRVDALVWSLTVLRDLSRNNSYKLCLLS